MEGFDGTKTWVIDADMPGGQAFRVWLRQDDGYPVQLTSSPNQKTPYLDLKVNLSAFDRGIQIGVPPRNELDPRYWGTEYNGPIPLDGGTVTIHQAMYDCNGGDGWDDSRSDGYFILVPFSYTSGAKPLVIDPAVWTLYDTFGHPYPAQALGSSAETRRAAGAGGRLAVGRPLLRRPMEPGQPDNRRRSAWWARDALRRRPAQA